MGRRTSFRGVGGCRTRARAVDVERQVPGD